MTSIGNSSENTLSTPNVVLTKSPNGALTEITASAQRITLSTPNVVLTKSPNGALTEITASAQRITLSTPNVVLTKSPNGALTEITASAQRITFLDSTLLRPRPISPSETSEPCRVITQGHEENRFAVQAAPPARVQCA